MPEPDWTPALLDVLADIGPATLEEISKALSDNGHPVEIADLRREVQARPDLMEREGRWQSVWPLVEGAVLTHVITDEEIEADALLAGDDLDLWARLADEGMPLASGGQVTTRWLAEHGDELTGPPGWLAGCTPDALVGLRCRRGTLHLLPSVEVDDPSDDALALVPMAHAAALQAACGRADEPEPEPEMQSALVDEVVLDLLRERPGALADPIPPLGFLLSLTGLLVRRGTVALAAGRSTALGVEDQIGLSVIRGMLRAAALTDDEPATEPATDPTTAPATGQATELRDVAQALLDDPELLEILAEEVLDDAHTLAGLGPFHRQVATGREAAVPAYLLATVAERVGEQGDAQAFLDEALAAAPDHQPSLHLAGVLAAERGDAFTAEALLRRAGQPSDGPDRSLLRAFLKAPAGDLPRNRPCPCGSGRKYKACCGAAPTHPLRDRAVWRYRRAVIYALHPPYQADVLEIAEGLGELRPDNLDPLAVDLALFEDGVLEDYLVRRGALMPADERALVERWVEERIGLYEVLDTAPGTSATVRRLPDGAPVTLPDRLLSERVDRLDLLLMRVLDDGTAPAVMSPPKLINRRMRSHLLEALEDDDVDAYAVAAALAPRLPAMQTTEGEELVLCSARYQVVDVDAVWQRLVDSGLRDDDDDLVEMADGVLRGRLRRAGDTVTIETTALERLRRLQQRLLDAAPDARLISESSRPIESMLADAEPSADWPQADSPPADVPPEVMAQVAQSLEDRWLTESVPALDGLTPRQAVEDPGVRPKLVSLLDDFEWHERQLPAGGVGMRTERLRAELGL